MIRTALKTVFAHKLRLALTALSVMTGVAFIAGTFIFTDTIDRTFSDLFADAFAGQDVVVQSETEFDIGFAGPPPFDEAVLDTVRGVDGVAAAEGSVAGFAVIYDNEGEAIVPQGPPTLGGSWMEDEQLMGNIRIREGRRPTAPDEVSIDASTADNNELAVGDVIKVQTPSDVAEYELVSIVGFGESDNLAGATFAGFDLRTAQRLFGLDGQFSSIVVRGDEGVSPDGLATRIGLALPDGMEAVTASSEAEAQSESLSESLGFLRTALLVFAAVAVFVAAFIIQNTFRIIVRQRQQELALMRAVGATGSQVVWMVVIEALVVGVVASIVGILFGLVIATGLTAVMGALGFDLPSTTAPLALRTILIGIAVGVGVTVAAAVLPAVRASHIPPVAAMRDMDVSLRMSDRARLVIGLAGLGIGVALIIAGLFGDVIDLGPLNELTAVGIGALLVFLAVSILSSSIVKPAAVFLGRRWVLLVITVITALVLIGGGLGLIGFGVVTGGVAIVGVLIPALMVLAIGALAAYLAWSVVRDRFTPGLATENSVRKPRRTATTASALMIGLALVTFFFVLGDSIKASAGAAIEEGLRADYVLSVNGFGGGFSPALAASLAQQPEIAAVTSMRFGIWDRNGSEEFLMAVDTGTIDETVFLDIRQGSLADLGAGGVFVNADVADEQGLTVGDTIPMGFATSGLQQVPIVGLYREANVVQSNYVVGLDFYAENFEGFGTDTDFVVAVKAAEGVAPETSRTVVEAAAADYSNVTVRDQAEYRQSQQDQVNTVLVLFNALLILAVIIAIVGIANTLALSIFERTREIGLLRAVGTSRGQIVRTVSWESLMVAIIGTVLGIVVGMFFGVAVTAALRSQGIDVLSIPGGQIAALVVFGAIAGLFAAILPARRAARLNILEAIAYE